MQHVVSRGRCCLTRRRRCPPPASSFSSTPPQSDQSIPPADKEQEHTHTHSWTTTFATHTRKDLQAFHPLLRTAQVVEALRAGYEQGTLSPPCSSSTRSHTHTDATELPSLMRVTRTRPSLLTPLASTLGVGLRVMDKVVLPLFPLAAAAAVAAAVGGGGGGGGGTGKGNIGEGVLAAVHESLDGNVRKLIEMERRETEGKKEEEKKAEVGVKEYMKKQRDSLHSSGGDEGGKEGEKENEKEGILTTSTQVLCRTLLKAAERL